MLFLAVPVLPTTLDGLLFARTYQRSESTLQASLEHALRGDFLFILGLGWCFYGGLIGGNTTNMSYSLSASPSMRRIDDNN